MNVVQSQNFKLFPINKSQNGSYSFSNNSPVITFSFNENNMRVIQTSTMKLCGKVRIFLKNDTLKRLPANRFDLTCSDTSQQDYEKVCYMDPRVSINSMLSVVNCSNMKNNLLEQVRNYNRNLASLIPVMSSFKDLNSKNQHSYASYPNLECISRVVQSEVPFCLPVRTGFLDSSPNILLNNNGFQLELNLDSNNMVLLGLNSNEFEVEFRDLYLTGRYLILDRPLPNAPVNDEYSSFHNNMVVLNSGNDHTNINLQLKEVNTIYHNSIPSAWLNSFSHNSLATPSLMNYDTDYERTKINKIDFNRGAVRYPLQYSVDEKQANRANAFQALRSRYFLNAIYPYAKNKKCSISPDSEYVHQMVEKRTDYKKTPQSLDQGLVKQWQYTAGSDWERDGNIESSGEVFGYGISLDNLHVQASSDYSNASYNFSVDSDVDNTANNQFIFSRAVTQLLGDANNVVAIN